MGSQEEALILPGLEGVSYDLDSCWRQSKHWNMAPLSLA